MNILWDGKHKIFVLPVLHLIGLLIFLKNKNFCNADSKISHETEFLLKALKNYFLTYDYFVLLDTLYLPPNTFPPIYVQTILYYIDKGTYCMWFVYFLVSNHLTG